MDSGLNQLHILKGQINDRRDVYNLKKGTTYYVRVRAYKADSVGMKVFGKYNADKRKNKKENMI